MCTNSRWTVEDDLRKRIAELEGSMSALAEVAGRATDDVEDRDEEIIELKKKLALENARADALHGDFVKMRDLYDGAQKQLAEEKDSARESREELQRVLAKECCVEEINALKEQLTASRESAMEEAAAIVENGSAFSEYKQVAHIHAKWIRDAIKPPAQKPEAK